jgi:hypothetical protein
MALSPAFGISISGRLRAAKDDPGMLISEMGVS